MSQALDQIGHLQQILQISARLAQLYTLHLYFTHSECHADQRIQKTPLVTRLRRNAVTGSGLASSLFRASITSLSIKVSCVFDGASVAQ